MFKVDNYVDTAASNAKIVLGYIPNEDVRTSFETIVDAQAQFTKTVFGATTDLAKLATDSVVKAATEVTKAKK